MIKNISLFSDWKLYWQFICLNNDINGLKRQNEQNLITTSKMAQW